MNPTVDVIKALGSLDGNRDFGIFMDWVHAAYQKEVEQMLVQPNPVLVHQAQGYARCLADILRSVTTNQTALNRLGQGGRMNT
jgi:hypothetical protein